MLFLFMLVDIDLIDKEEVLEIAITKISSV